ncbi:MAG TPA: hypothetical protein PKC18_12700, partial [Lacipirellulaceae bacterium]|nr:hypothetical protein [Lacipirellulaceae bacterium]
RRVFQQLPGGDAEVRIEKRQPITLRIYRTAAAATVCLINESPWPVAVELPIDHAESVAWRDLGLPDDAGGSLEPGAAPWRTTIGPYGLAARRYDNRNVRVGALTTSLGAGPAAALAARISDVEGRMKGMDIERPYPQLQNANFELVGADQKMLGWQPLVGAAGSVAVDDAAAAAGSRSLRLRSDDALGVAAQSLRFPIPATGQLVVRAQVRTDQLAEAARLSVWVECAHPGGTVRQPKPLDGVRADGQWHKCEATFDDLPLASGDQMRVQLHLAGPGQAWVDAVEMFDLRFPDAQRNELVKRVFAARTALDEGRLVDCQRQLDGYWPRYLVENVPAGPAASPAAPSERPAASLAARPAEAPSAPPEGEGGLGDRVRRFVPRVWR